MEKLLKMLKKINDKICTVRGVSPLTHGWQTQKLAKASRSWDLLAIEKNRIIDQLRYSILNMDQYSFIELCENCNIIPSGKKENDIDLIIDFLIEKQNTISQNADTSNHKK